MFKNLSVKNSFKIENLKLKIVLYLFIGTLYLAFPLKAAVAESSYVLPYPPPMPGSLFYKIRLVSEQIQKYWYFGNFGQFTYNLKQSDKYLVQAKTLFDYKQYLLGDKALHKSDKYFEKIYPYLLSAKTNGKNTTEKEKILKSALEKHVEELVKIRSSVPSVFEWIPENEPPTTLNLRESLDLSIKIRKERLRLEYR